MVLTGPKEAERLYRSGLLLCMRALKCVSPSMKKMQTVISSENQPERHDCWPCHSVDVVPKGLPYSIVNQALGKKAIPKC